MAALRLDDFPPGSEMRIARSVSEWRTNSSILDRGAGLGGEIGLEFEFELDLGATA